MEDMDHGLSPRKIYPEPSTRGTYDTQGRLARCYYCDEEVPRFAEQHEELRTAVHHRRATGVENYLYQGEYRLAPGSSGDCHQEDGCRRCSRDDTEICYFDCTGTKSSNACDLPRLVESQQTTTDDGTISTYVGSATGAQRFCAKVEYLRHGCVRPWLASGIRYHIPFLSTTTGSLRAYLSVSTPPFV